MTVVDRWKHKVLKMPAESWVFHSHVHPWHIYAWHVLHILKLEHWIYLVLKIIQVPFMIFKLISFTIFIKMMVSASKSAAKFTCIEVSCILNFQIFASLVINDFPILSFNLIINFWVIIPIYVIIFAFSLFGNSLKISKSMTYLILMEWLPLSKLLQYLEPSR